MRKTFSLPVAASAVPPPGPTVDNIEYSVRFNSAYLSRIPSSSGNRKTWTWAGWVKRSNFAGTQTIFSADGPGSDYFQLRFLSTGTISIVSFKSTALDTQLSTSAVYRDPSAWYHVVLSFDATQTLGADRVKVYVNGEEQTLSGTFSSLNTEQSVNANGTHYQGIYVNTNYFDGYLANVHFIDGQALTPSSFGFTDSDNVWQPKAYTGDYGTEDYPGATTDSSGSFYSGRGPENLFDGDTTTLCDPALADGTITFTPTTGIPYSSSVEVYTGSNFPSGNYTQASVNGGTAVSVTTSNAWFTVASGPGTLNSLSIRLPGYRPNWKAIRIDGKILVNSPNGYHLDFADTSSATALGNDVSGNNNDWTPNGLVAGPAYTANSFSTEFDGTGDYLSIPDNNALDLGTGDFTIEFWVYANSLTNTDGIIGKRDSNSFGSNSWRIAYSSSNSSINLAHTDSSSASVSYASAPSLNTWTHYAFARDSGTMRAFKNGVKETDVSSYTHDFSNTYSLLIGANATSSYTWDGKISNLRMIKGRALYTAAFTPPSTALTAVTDTVLLTCQDSTLIDNSPSAHTITATGDAATTTVSPFEPVDGSDAMLDSPTNYGSGDLVRGNYCTWNPLTKGTYANGNLASTNNTYEIGTGTIGVSSGKWYWEITNNDSSQSQNISGVTPAPYLTAEYVGKVAGAGYGLYLYDSNEIYNGTVTGGYGVIFSQGDVLNVALDLDNGNLWFGRNGTWFNSGNPAAGTNALVTGLTGTWYPAISSASGSVTASANFGQQPFKYPLAGYKPLCSTNLPTPAVADGSTAMDVKLYTGNGSTQTISGLGFSPDLAWFKSRSGAVWHAVVDAVRGRSKGLSTNSTNSEYTSSSANDLVSFDSTGFTLGPLQNWSSINKNGESIVVWAWDAGSSTVSNTDGTITSQVRANPTAGISIVSYTGTGANATIGHGLNAAPEMIIVKNRDAAVNWNVYHVGTNASTPEQYFLRLNTTDAAISASAKWNDTSPTSSVFSVGTSGNTNSSGANLISYCFAPVEGFSAFGSYTGNASADGPFVYTGFKPRWILIKSSSNTETWNIYDTTRGTYNVVNRYLQAQSTAAEGTNHALDILSNGFKMRLGGGGGGNSNGATYIYAAFAEHPFKTSRAR